MTFQHILGISVTLAVIVALSIYSGKVTKKNQKGNTWVVAGAIMGTLVGGSSTVGTAQLAYNFGMSAWWYTLGSGIACLILALLYAVPFRKHGNKTLISIVQTEYGKTVGLLCSVLSSLGSFINIISQLLAATAIIAVVFPTLPIIPSLLAAALFMIVYVIFGGTKGSGIVGILKMLLLYVATMACGILVLILSGGFSGFSALVKTIHNPEQINFYSLFARGVGTDLGAGLSLVFGVITTQSYAQALFMADKTKHAVKGALLSAFLTPPIGIGGILVGLYMRSVHPGIVAKTALTLFVTEYMPPLFGGIILGALFIAAVGTGSGLALGISTVVKNNILPLLFRKKAFGNKTEKILIALCLLGASFLAMGPLGDTILNFAFMSMALRGATLFMPLCCALWCKGKISAHFAGIAVVTGPLVVMVFGLLKVLPFDPLFLGIFAAAVIMLPECIMRRLTSGKKDISNPTKYIE